MNHYVTAFCILLIVIYLTLIVYSYRNYKACCKEEQRLQELTEQLEKINAEMKGIIRELN